MKTMGEIIREKRKQKELKQYELAKLLGCHGDQVSKWESGEVVPHLFTVCDLADIFECSLDELCGRQVV